MGELARERLRGQDVYKRQTFGTAPNLLVWEAGGYSVKDYLKCGFPMLIIFGVVTTALCAVFYL